MYAEWKMVKSLRTFYKYRELKLGLKPVGRPKIRFKAVCKGDMVVTGLPSDNW